MSKQVCVKALINIFNKADVDTVLKMLLAVNDKHYLAEIFYDSVQEYAAGHSEEELQKLVKDFLPGIPEYTKAEFVAAVPKGHLPDYVKVDDIVYTMDYYDEEGKLTTYQNKKHRLEIDIITSDRYENGFKDAKVLFYESSSFRTDVEYLE